MEYNFRIKTLGHSNLDILLNLQLLFPQFEENNNERTKKTLCCFAKTSVIENLPVIRTLSLLVISLNNHGTGPLSRNMRHGTPVHVLRSLNS